MFGKEGALPGWRVGRETIPNHVSNKVTNGHRSGGEPLARNTAAPRMGKCRAESTNTWNNRRHQK